MLHSSFLNSSVSRKMNTQLLLGEVGSSQTTPCSFPWKPPQQQIPGAAVPQFLTKHIPRRMQGVTPLFLTWFLVRLRPGLAQDMDSGA